ncbi:M36 family metallopeptidase [Hymenobacter sp. BT559]|uniref:M36 family metallopeptidase n=1 Tax=Hymenobacter sp. BT559 TaxID=2795729 RepID=UPI0018EE0119|nr:M36 family metallopeptidase [Hymenobacter sp. BT559]MBJ6145663.1 M36 family metallopeptidase [Hymenobacter sp. BT559]
MSLSFTSLDCRTLVLAAALVAPSWAAAQQPAPTPALSAFAARAKAQGLSSADVASPLVTSTTVDANTGITHTYLQQRVNGLVVFNATGAVHTDKEGKVLFAIQDFVPDAAKLAPSPTPTLTPEQAVTAAAVALGLPRPVGLHLLNEARVADGLVYNNGGISETDIPVRLLYARVNGKLVLAWNVTIAQLDQQHYWNARVDAQTGRLVDKNDYTVSEQATFGQYTQRAQHQQQQALAFSNVEAPAATFEPTGTTAANSLTAFPFPLENPKEGARQAVPLAAVGSAYSPYGWQVSQAPNGTFADTYSYLSTNKYLTRGNNVAAYDDNSSTSSGASTANFNSSTTSPDGSATLDFDFPFDQAAGARNNLSAATTNLFYVNNMVHDVMLAHGFDEVSGNFQYKNATTSGRALDPVRAEAQDGAGRNNANFSTPLDGSMPTMQMYLWDNVSSALTITAPSTVAGSYAFGTASFGPSISSLPNGLCGNIVPVNDGVSADDGIHSCAAPTNAAALAGNIALIMRGGCTAPASNNFSDKVKFAQAAGAIGAIIYDSDPNSTAPIGLGGTDATVTIPAIGISGVLGTRLKAALTGGTVGVGCAKVTTFADWDGSFDNGIIAHEYGHGISNRLTGTPYNSASCATQTYNNGDSYTQVMGEGWSDFFALWMTTKPGDDGSAIRYLGYYVKGGTNAAGPGIRTKPYSTNFTRNNLTYGAIITPTATNTFPYQESHSLGEIWAETLWDLNWQFIYKYGYNSDLYGSTGGNNKALRLVLDACKIQACNPGFLQGRDAILRADSLTNRGANSDLIWNVFARRGMGYSAKAGDRLNGLPVFTGIAEAFDLPARANVVVLANQNSAVVSSALEAFPNPAQDRLTVRTQLSSTTPMHVTVVDLLGKTVLAPATVPVAQMQQRGVELNTSHLAPGIYVVRVSTTSGTYTTKVTIQR